jgi:hypothetical protein
MIGSWATKYDALKDWAGPRSFDQTPIGQLRQQEDCEPEVSACLAHVQLNVCTRLQGVPIGECS